VVLVLAGLALAAALLLLWAVMAVLYAPAAKLGAWFLDRELAWGSARRLCGAALLPGAVLMAAGVVLYGSQAVDIFGLVYFATVHILIGWIYVAGAVFFIPQPDSSTKVGNPFQPK
jgi:hypothetical protein